MIANPILPGFNADPSILRVENDYYIATSTFAWFPGVALWHSRDLANWRLLTHPLSRISQLDLRGEGSSCGVWAPCLRFDQETKLFTLLYTNVKNITSRFFDLDNFLVTAPSIEGPWSEPIYLNSSGFDPSILFDDGRAYVANLEWEFRDGYDSPGVIVLQEYSRSEARLIGEPRRIYRGATDLGCLEGPNLYRHGEWYYLMAAEGGTGYGHSVTMARSKTPWGPYEGDPENPILTSLETLFQGRKDDDFLKPQHFNPTVAIQKPGHASLVETQAGEWYLVHLGARPLVSSDPAAAPLACVLGRETFLQRCYWTAEGWLRLEDSSKRPRELVTEPAGIFLQAFPAVPHREDFDCESLPNWFYSAREPVTESWANLRERPGWLCLAGRRSLHSLHEQSLIGRRVEHFVWEAQTLIDFQPSSFRQMAGLVVLQGIETWYYLRVYCSESLGCLAVGIQYSDRLRLGELRENRLELPEGPVRLRANAHGRWLRFAVSTSRDEWNEIGPALDFTRISDEHNRSFAGSFVGLCCQDLGGRGGKAYFDWFEYKGELTWPSQS